MKFEELKEKAEKAIEDDLTELATEVLAERLREIINLENLLATAKKQLEELLKKEITDVVEV